MMVRAQTLRLLIALLGVLVYANSLGGQFVFDDVKSIVWNEHLTRLWPPSIPLTAPAQSPLAGRPVSSLTFAINYAIGDLRPAGYHTFNIALHVACALLLFEIARRTFAFRGQESPLAAAAIAAIWTVHPLQTEAVDYLTQRTELMVSLFFLLTLYCSIRSWTETAPRRWIAAAIISSMLGMLSKEVMVSAPLVVLLYDRTFVSDGFLASLRRRRALYAGLAASWLVLAAIVLAGPRSESVGFRHGISALDYLRTQAGVITYYLRLAFWPNALVISYRDWPIARTLGPVLPKAVFILALLVTTAFALYRRSAIGFLLATFFLILAPSSSFVPIATEWVAERRMYLPLAAVISIAVLAVRALLLPPPKTSSSLERASIWTPPVLAGTVLTLALVIPLSARTIARNRQYASPVMLLEDNVRRRPANYEAKALLAENLIDLGRYDEADSLLRAALRLKPDYLGAMNNLGLSLAMRGQYEAAIQQFSAALRELPNAEVHVNLGNALLGLNRSSEAVANYEEAIKLDPRSATAHNALGRYYWEHKNLRLAEEELAESVRLSPDFPEAQFNLGRVLVETHRPEEGIKRLEESLRLRPTAEVHTYLAQVLEKEGRSSEAAAHYAAAEELQRR